jgi:hypothetical protein
MQRFCKHAVAATALAAVATLSAGNARALDVSGTEVDSGVLEFENGGFIGFDGDSSRLSTEFEAAYGLNDRVQLKLAGEWDKNYSDKTRYNGTGLEAQFEIFQPGEAWLNTAVEVGYAFAADPNRADSISAALLLEKEYLRFRHRLNVGVAQEVGEFNEDGASWELAWQTVYKVTDDFNAGFEYYGVLGEADGFFDQTTDNEHLLGPVVTWDLPGLPISTEVGYLVGLTNDSADHGLRWKVSVAF